MYLGRIVEIGDTDEDLPRPKHPYTHALLAAVPVPVRASGAGARWRGRHADADQPAVGLPVPSALPARDERCRVESPALREVAGRQVACHLAETRV